MVCRYRVVHTGIPLGIKVFRTALYRPIWVVRISPMVYRYMDRPIPGGTNCYMVYNGRNRPLQKYNGRN
ncbi:hypothetical protein BHM03_00044885 [Ensete ventricosum]|nr:hypothetical protein BHM03_00044885 [Ensete ventricosum]